MSIHDLRLVCRSDADDKGRREIWLTWRHEKLIGDFFDCRSQWHIAQFAKKSWGLIPVPDPFAEWDDFEWGRMIAEKVDPAIEAWQAEKALGTDSTGAKRELTAYSLPELDLLECNERYVINGVIPHLEHGIISANVKNGKTHFAADAIVSVATGTNFLNCDKFTVQESMPAGLISLETGTRSFQEMFRRICGSKGLAPADVPNAFLSTERIEIPRDIMRVEQFIRRYSLGLLFFDPSYLIFAAAADRSSSDMAMGAMLGMVSDVGNRTGCTIGLVNHSTKHRPKDMKRFDPPDINEIAHAGYSAWMRWYILLNTRKEFDAEVGRHSLNMKTGGSGVDVATWAVDILEGKRSDPGGRVWEVDVRTAGEDRRQRDDEREQIEADRQQRVIDANVGKLRRALKKFPNGETIRTVRDRAGLNGNAMTDALEVLESRGEVEYCKVPKGKQTYDGIKTKGPWDFTGTRPLYVKACPVPVPLPGQNDTRRGRNMARPKRPTKAEMRATLDSFIFTSDDMADGSSGERDSVAGPLGDNGTGMSDEALLLKFLEFCAAKQECTEGVGGAESVASGDHRTARSPQGGGGL